MRARPGVYRQLSLIVPELLAELGKLASGLAPWPLYLFGPVGTGKSFAALSMCDATYEAIYTTVEEMADRTMDRTAPPLWDLIGKYDLAVLDEIGARSSELFYGVVEKFADTRERRGRVAIYGSNLSPEELNKTFDNRIADRLTCGTRFFLGGKSRRMPAGGEQ